MFSAPMLYPRNTGRGHGVRWRDDAEASTELFAPAQPFARTQDLKGCFHVLLPALAFEPKSHAEVAPPNQGLLSVILFTVSSGDA
jgi:hypothetical protein